MDEANEAAARSGERHGVSVEFADRLREYWQFANQKLDEGGISTIRVDPTFVDDLKQAEALARVAAAVAMLADLAIKR